MIFMNVIVTKGLNNSRYILNEKSIEKLNDLGSVFLSIKINLRYEFDFNMLNRERKI